MLWPVPRSKIVGKTERKKKSEKNRVRTGERELPAVFSLLGFSLLALTVACALLSLLVRFFRSSEREPGTGYDHDDPFSGESRIPNFIHHFPQRHFLFQSTSVPKGW